ncbi:MAG: alpha/beta hydrolase family protein [Pseudomonadota bacterium]
MAAIECKIFSETLGMTTGLRVLLPEPSRRPAGRAAHPVLFLLHGLSDDESAWTRFSGLERYVLTLGLAVVMPNVNRSYYSNMKHGYRYWDYVSDELLVKARALFPLSARREATFVAGQSMGGYGALKLALSMPETFAAAASLSGTCDLGNLRQRPEELALVFGDVAGIRKSGADLQELGHAAAQSRGPKPKIFQCCGTEDALLAGNRAFRDVISPLGFDYTYEESPGSHDWAYWDRAIERVLRWLPLP